jgi:membrane protein involved in colicin uptake
VSKFPERPVIAATDVARGEEAMQPPVQREGSLTFSLAELTRLETERQRDEESRARELQAARVATEQEATRKRLEKESLEARAREQQRRDEERMAAEREARLRAVEAGELLRAKTEADLAARAKAETEAHRHAEALAQLRAGEQAWKWKVFVAASWGATLAVTAIFLFVDFGIVRPESARRVAAAEAATERQSVDLRAARDQKRDAERTAEGLRGDLAEQKRAAERLQAELDRTQAEIVRLRGAAPSSGHPTQHRAPNAGGPFSTACPPDSRDPLCGLTH